MSDDLVVTYTVSISEVECPTLLSALQRYVRMCSENQNAFYEHSRLLGAGYVVRAVQADKSSGAIFLHLTFSRKASR